MLELVAGHWYDSYHLLEATYVKAKVNLNDVLGNTESFLTPSNSDREAQVLMLAPTPKVSDDYWCIDTRGVLTLSVCKETYESLGIVGKPLPFKGHSDVHVIDIPLQKINVESSAKVQQKQKQSVERWEQRRKSDGAADWDVVYCSNRVPEQAPKLPFIAAEASQTRKVACEKAEYTNVYIPIPSFEPRPVKQRKGKVHAELEDQEDWDREVMHLFEWAGLAALGSPRISANDRTDAYVAVYEPPRPSAIAGITHLRWRGLLSPAFVQSIVQQVSSWLEASMEVDGQDHHPKFAFITVHSVPTSPVTYVSSGTREASKRLPRDDNEDTMCLLLGKAPSGKVSWTTVECLGPWDTRWG
ncbi:ribonuclease P 40kDa subunit-domain-containing protein [Coprinopsis sp. MPI-PUGE-AT-0042]|nr:ribonuclease P 40kDa subunit-domain-containing protein [Coprinopsis sp. MPI-PUGE-AT-0042]